MVEYLRLTKGNWQSIDVREWLRQGTPGLIIVIAVVIVVGDFVLRRK